MPTTDVALVYQQVASQGRSQVGWIVALCDTILRDFRRALAALDAANVEARVFELNHALTVIGHLEETLDHKQGAEAATHFERLYQMTRGMIVSANAHASRSAINELIEIYTPIRDAWRQVEQQLQTDRRQGTSSSEQPDFSQKRSSVREAATPQTRGRVTTPAAHITNVSPTEPQPTRGRWSA